MAHDLRLLFAVPFTVGFAACGFSGVGGGTSTSTSGAGGGTTSASGSGGGTTSASGSGGGTTSASGTGGGAAASSSSAGGAGAGGMASTTTSSTSASTAASTSASTGGFVCLARSDCPSGNAPCMVPTCTSGVCGMGPLAAGMDALMQTPGNCQKEQCDGQGNVVPTPDPTDIPGAGNPCVVGSCVGGIPKLTPLTGVACNQNGGKVCASGTCVECSSYLDCPGSNDCTIAGCFGGQCHLIPDSAACTNPPPCHETPAICGLDGCSYTSVKTGGAPCPGGACSAFNGNCTPCAQYCPPPLPCQLLVCTNNGALVACTYPSAPQGTSCPGGTCNGNGACL
jgi:hypothetical protein